MRAIVLAATIIVLAPPGYLSGQDTTTALDGWTAKHPEVTRYLDFFQGAGRAQMQRWLDRGAQYRDLIRGHLDREGLPSEFEFLPMIESGYSTTARSRVGAGGMWQFMPETAREYGLRVDGVIDERRDPVLATGAAIRHLGDLTRSFGSTTLAAAAYNSGAGRIRSGLDEVDDEEASPSGAESFRRLARRGFLPTETKNYVPQFVAAATIGRDPARYGFAVAPTRRASADSVSVARPIRLASLAKAAAIDPAILAELNPSLVGGVTPRGARWVKVPSNQSDTFQALIPTLPTIPLPTVPLRRGGSRLGALVRVIRGDDLAAIAQRHGVDLEALRKVNALPKDGSVRVGQALRLPGR